MNQDQAMPGIAGTRRYGREEEVDGAASSRISGPIIRILVGLVIAVDASLLAAPLYFGTPSPCHMVALSQASIHNSVVDDEIVLTDEMAYDVYHVSSVWVRSRESIASCAGKIGGRTLSALMP